MWQNSSDAQLSNWSRYAYAKWPFTSLGVGASTTKGQYKVGQSCNFWDRYVYGWGGEGKGIQLTLGACSGQQRPPSHSTYSAGSCPPPPCLHPQVPR